MVRFPEHPNDPPSGDPPQPGDPGETGPRPGPKALTRPSKVDRLGELADEIAEMAAHIQAAEHELLLRIAEFARCFEEAGGHSGFKTAAHWLAWRTGLGLGASREKVRVARALGELPRISEAFSRAEVSYSQVRAMTRVATPDNEERLVELARELTADQVEKVVRVWRKADQTEEEMGLSPAMRAQLRKERCGITLYPDSDGTWVLKGRLEPEVGAQLATALDAGAEVLYRSEEECLEAERRRKLARESATLPNAGDVPAGTSTADTLSAETPTADSCDAEAAEGTGGDPGEPTSESTLPAESRTPWARRRLDALSLLLEVALGGGVASLVGLEGEDDGGTGDGGQYDGGQYAGDETDDGQRDTPDTNESPAAAAADARLREQARILSSLAASERFQVVVHVDQSVLCRKGVDPEAGGGEGARGERMAGNGTAGSGTPSEEAAGDQTAITGKTGGEGPTAEARRTAPPDGECWLHDQVGISVETCERLACCGDRVIMVHGEDGSILDVGRRSRTVPTAILRALYYRDRGCRFPGCGLRICQSHHVEHWARGGRTSLDNLVLLCPRHHGAVHEGGYRVEMGPGQRPTFYRPDGKRLPFAPPPPPVPEWPLEALRQKNRARGLRLHARSHKPGWIGDRLDVNMALDAVRTMATRGLPRRQTG